MRVDFHAFADDCIIRGTVSLATDRLTELLSDSGELAIEAATFQALDDGRFVAAPAATILRGDICAVSAAGPRGSSQRRLRTRLQPMRAKVGPYTIVGYLHAPPTADPVVTALRRRIVPFTTASIEYELNGQRMEEAHDALLLGREKIEWLEAATDADVRLARDLGAKRAFDPNAKDLTGAIVG